MTRSKPLANTLMASIIPCEDIPPSAINRKSLLKRWHEDHSRKLAANSGKVHFANDEKSEGYLKDGPVAAAKFELGEDAEMKEARILRQRDVADLIMRLLQEIGT